MNTKRVFGIGIGGRDVPQSSSAPWRAPVRSKVRRRGPRPGGPGRHRRRRERAPKGRRPACGSSPRRPTCRRSSCASSSPTIADAISFPTCRRRPTACGFAATAWSIRRRSQARPGKQLNLTAVAGAESARGGAVLSRRLLVLADARAGQERVPRHRPGGNGISPNIKSQADWMRTMKSGGCTGRAISSARRRRASCPTALGTFRSSADGVGAAHPVGAGRAPT